MYYSVPHEVLTLFGYSLFFYIYLAITTSVRHMGRRETKVQAREMAEMAQKRIHTPYDTLMNGRIKDPSAKSAPKTSHGSRGSVLRDGSRHLSLYPPAVVEKKD